MRVNITETVLRDANQSLVATRMPFSDFEPILELMDQAGYYSLECWGGATFDSCLRYLNEDPWERLRKIKSKVKNTNLQMLLRGQNLLGYKHYPNDVVRKFVTHAAINGIDIFRIFDALNDFRNIQVGLDEVLKGGKHAQGCICYTISPIHSIEKYARMGKELQTMGVHSICIKDMAGIMSPKEAYELVKALKSNVNVPVVLHTHSTTGLGPITCAKAIEAGCDGIDTAISSMSNGTSQPPTETLNYVIKQMGLETGLNESILKKINDYFKTIRAQYISSGLMDPFVMGTETDALIYQIPGGMLSNLISQLKSQNAIDRLDEVLSETPKVRKDLGYPPLVTPMSQIVGVQAAVNILSGEKYKSISKEVKSYIRGEYGKTPGEINPDLFNKVLGDEKPMTIRFADTMEPLFDKTKTDLEGIARSDEDVLSYIAFPQIAEEFFRNKEEQESKIVSYTITKK